jgi:cytochrome c oxidase cbb3-type subunit 1
MRSPTAGRRWRASGLAIWLLPRLLKTTLRAAASPSSVHDVERGLIAGLGAIAVGFSSGREWLEIPWQVAMLLVIGGGLVALPLSSRCRAGRSITSTCRCGTWAPRCSGSGALSRRQYSGLHFGVEEATMNWWYGHNVLGLFFTPLALASIYYFMPKVIGRPVQSYNLSLLGFWTLAFFYGQVGGHHLIGGPVPGWLITLSIVQSMMMIIPVLAFATNQYPTMRGYNHMLLVFADAALCRVRRDHVRGDSIQGSFEALRTINAVTHFTPLHRRARAPWLYRLRHDGVLRRHLFRDAAGDASRMAVPTADRTPFLAVGAAASSSTSSPDDRRLAAGHGHARCARPFMESVDVTISYLKMRSLGGA